MYFRLRKQGLNGIVACSALKHLYRQILKQGMDKDRTTGKHNSSAIILVHNYGISERKKYIVFV